MNKRKDFFKEFTNNLPYKSITAVVLVLLLVLPLLQVPLFSPNVTTVQAATSDFSIIFAAAAPHTYNHFTGGGAFDDRTVGVDDDIVNSLEGGDFVCGDIVTFFAEVTVDDQTTDGPQTIEMDFSFLMDTTGQSGVAIGDIVDVFVNYGTIAQWDVDGDGDFDVIGDGDNETDAGIIDDGGSDATLEDEWTTGPIFSAGSELWGTVQLTDLDAGEQVVVRIDVQLSCDPLGNPTGNLQGAFEAARLTYVNDNVQVDPPQTIQGGAQTIPFQNVELIIFLDFGDLPESDVEPYWMTTLAQDGARHGLSGVYLGDSIDADSDGQPTNDALGDDNDNLNDEDGIILPGDYDWNDGTGELQVTVNGGYGCLTGWLDFTDGSGFGRNFSFGDSYTDPISSITYDELIINNMPLPSGENSITFDLPPGAADGTVFYGRFRLVAAQQDNTCGEAPGLTGYWPNGEVEDYIFIFDPTAVTLTDFAASSNGGLPAGLLIAAGLLSIALLAFYITSRRRSHLNG